MLDFVYKEQLDDPDNFVKRVINIDQFIELTNVVKKLGGDPFVFPWGKLINHRIILDHLIRCEKNLDDILAFAEDSLGHDSQRNLIQAACIVRFYELNDSGSWNFAIQLFIPKFLAHPALNKDLLLGLMTQIKVQLFRKKITKFNIEKLYQLLQESLDILQCDDVRINTALKQLVQTLKDNSLSLLNTCIQFFKKNPAILNSVKDRMPPHLLLQFAEKLPEQEASNPTTSAISASKSTKCEIL